MAMMYARRGCQILVYPAAFNMTTGPLHWELLQRARAVDNQVFVMSCSPARNNSECAPASVAGLRLAAGLEGELWTLGVWCLPSMVPARTA